jgi:peptide/nickel transport system permease protein
MLSHIVRRMVATIPVMAIVALFVFSLLYIAPGDPAAVIAGDQLARGRRKIRCSLISTGRSRRFWEWSRQIVHVISAPDAPGARRE